MKKLKKMIHNINDELNSAEDYAEKYVMYKNTNPGWASLYSEMAVDELSHADALHRITDDFASKLAYITENDKECWDKCVKRIAETTSSVKLLLSK